MMLLTYILLLFSHIEMIDILLDKAWHLCLIKIWALKSLGPTSAWGTISKSTIRAFHAHRAVDTNVDARHLGVARVRTARLVIEFSTDPLVRVVVHVETCLSAPDRCIDTIKLDGSGEWKSSPKVSPLITMTTKNKWQQILSFCPLPLLTLETVVMTNRINKQIDCNFNIHEITQRDPAPTQSHCLNYLNIIWIICLHLFLILLSWSYCNWTNGHTLTCIITMARITGWTFLVVNLGVTLWEVVFKAFTLDLMKMGRIVWWDIKLRSRHYAIDGTETELAANDL